MLMGQQRVDASKRTAQHILAREIVELAHGAAEAMQAETAHKEAFSNGTTTFSLGALRSTLDGVKPTMPPRREFYRKNKLEHDMIAYKKAYAAASSGTQNTSSTASEPPKPEDANVVLLPLSMLQPGSFPRVLHAAGLASSKSEAHRLIASKGAYVVVPNSGSMENPTALQWMPIEDAAAADPNLYLVDFEALILRSGKSKIQICRIMLDKEFEALGLSCPGWDEMRAKRAEDADA
jgi:tyrosyl-tRNA synthetase